MTSSITSDRRDRFFQPFRDVGHHDLLDLPFPQIIVAELADTSYFGRDTGEAGTVLIEPLFDQDANRCRRETADQA